MTGDEESSSDCVKLISELSSVTIGTCSSVAFGCMYICFTGNKYILNYKLKNFVVLLRALIECHVDAGRKEDASQVSNATLVFTKANVPALYTTVLGLQVMVIKLLSQKLLHFFINNAATVSKLFLDGVWHPPRGLRFHFLFPQLYTSK